jgi:C-terminal processing protease CtpA/Prc
MGLPLVALVSSGTARAAELVAGALDNRRAVL